MFPDRGVGCGYGDGLGRHGVDGSSPRSGRMVQAKAGAAGNVNPSSWLMAFPNMIGLRSQSIAPRWPDDACQCCAHSSASPSSAGRAVDIAMRSPGAKTATKISFMVVVPDS